MLCIFLSMSNIIKSIMWPYITSHFVVFFNESEGSFQSYLGDLSYVYFVTCLITIITIQ